MKTFSPGEINPKHRIQSFSLKILLIFSLATLVPGCKVYSPRNVPIHQFTGKNDLFVSGSLSIPAGVSGSVAYSPFSHISLQAHASAAPEETYYLQGAAGVYWTSPSATCFELIGGYGNGQGKAIKSPDPAYLLGEYDLYYLQFNIGQSIQKKKRIQYGIGLKSGVMNVNIADYGYYESNGLDPSTYHNRYILIEPTAYLRNSGKRISTGIYMSGTSLVSILPNQQFFPFNGLSAGFSVEYKIR